MATTKVSGPMPTEVRTIGSGTTFYLRGNKMTEGVRYGYFMYRQELRGALRALITNISGYRASVMYGMDGFSRCAVKKNDRGGISIGCKSFDMANTRKLARFAGLSPSMISKNFPSARAAASGR